jgi:hypothetical protein
VRCGSSNFGSGRKRALRSSRYSCVRRQHQRSEQIGVLIGEEGERVRQQCVAGAPSALRPP